MYLVHFHWNKKARPEPGFVLLGAMDQKLARRPTR